MLEESTETKTPSAHICLHGACAHSEVIIDEGASS